MGTAVRADGRTAARFADSRNVDVANQAGAEAFVKTPYHYEQESTVVAGSYDFQLAVGAGSGAVGKVSVPLKVEPWNAASFGMGSVAFSTSMHDVDAASLVAPSLETAQMMAGGKMFVPSARNRFGKTEAVYFYTEIYDPALSLAAGSAAPALTVEYRVLDAKSGTVNVDSGVGGVGSYVRPGNPVVPFATRLPLAQLAAGDYRLEIRTAGAGSGCCFAGGGVCGGMIGFPMVLTCLPGRIWVVQMSSDFPWNGRLTLEMYGWTHRYEQNSAPSPASERLRMRAVTGCVSRGPLISPRTPNA